jgi:hypothetical protein
LEEIQPLGKSFLISEAILVGIKKTDMNIPQSRRIHKINFWLPTELANQVKELSRLKETSQQNLMRHYLFHYLANPEELRG